MRYTLFIASLLIFTSVLSCKKHDNIIPASSTTSNGEDNPNSSNGNGDDNTNSSHAKMNYELIVANKSSGLAKTTGGIIQWTSGFADPQLVKFEAKQGATEIEFKSTNNARIDLMTLSPVSFGSFTIPDATYSEIELKIQLQKNGSTPALQLEGEFTGSGTTTPVKLSIDEMIELKTEQKNVTVTSGFNFTTITSLDLSLITSGISENELLNATLTNGILEISSGSNKSLYATILKNLQQHKHHAEIEIHHK